MSDICCGLWEKIVFEEIERVDLIKMKKGGWNLSGRPFFVYIQYER
jgi:hypothetical protein